MLLKVEELNKAFDGETVLENVNFDVMEGEVVSLVGKSGAGKTTLLRCVMGLEQCDQGTIMIGDQFLCRYDGVVTERASRKALYEIRKSLGMVFQNYHLFPHMTVLENVMVALTDVYKLDYSEAERSAVIMLEKLGLGDKLDNKPFELSGGQKQRVAIARSCVTNPQLLCFDEPTAALDSALVKDIIKIIRGLAKEGMGILIISHDENFVKEVSDRVLFMNKGRIYREMNTEEYRQQIDK